MLILNGLVALFPKLCSDLDTGFFIFFYERLNNVHNFIVKFAPDLPMSRRAKSWGNVLIKKKKKSLCENLSKVLETAGKARSGTLNRFLQQKKQQHHLGLLPQFFPVKIRFFLNVDLCCKSHKNRKKSVSKSEHSFGKLRTSPFRNSSHIS